MITAAKAREITNDSVSRTKAKENVAEATFQLRNSLAEVATKFKVSIEDIVGAFGDNLQSLDSPLKTLTPDMQKVQKALQKAAKAGEKDS